MIYAYHNNLVTNKILFAFLWISFNTVRKKPTLLMMCLNVHELTFEKILSLDPYISNLEFILVLC